MQNTRYAEAFGISINLPDTLKNTNALIYNDELTDPLIDRSA